MMMMKTFCELCETYSVPLMTTILRTPGLVLVEFWYNHRSRETLPPLGLDFDDWLNSASNLGMLIFGLALIATPFELLVYMVYMHGISALLVILADFLSEHYVQEEIEVDLSGGLTLLPFFKRQLIHFLCIWATNGCIQWCLNFDSKYKYYKWVPLFYLIPMIARVGMEFEIVPLTTGSLSQIHELARAAVIATSLIYGFFTVVIPTAGFFINMAQALWKLLAVHGITQFVIVTMLILADQAVLINFWFCLFFQQAWLEYNLASPIPNDTIWFFLLRVVSTICCTPLTLIASCLTVMVLSTSSVWLVSKYLSTCKSNIPNFSVNQDSSLSSGIAEGMVMFLLALQTDLIDLDITSRIGTMYIILFLVLASLTQTILEVSHPVLMALSSSATSASLFSHIKVLALCTGLCVTPAYMSYVLYSTVEMDLWTMVVISSSIVTSIQVVGHVVHYALYLYDSVQPEPIESMDDIVYYLKALVHSLELLSAFFIVCAGITEFSSGHWSVVNSVILTVHCYFNVWLRIINGWNSFLLRQAAIKKLSTLETATEEQIMAKADICSICYMDLAKNVKITPCGHYYHGPCLKKWLFIQDHCPLCSKKVIEPEPQNKEEEQEQIEEQREQQE